MSSLDGSLLAVVSTEYEGEKSASGAFEGSGWVKLSGGHAYEGEFRGGALEGEGVYTWASGLQYRGAFIGNKATGAGTYEWTDGSSFQGDVQDGKRHGTGTFVAAPPAGGESKSADGVVRGTEYAGGYVGGKKHGRGRMLYAGGASHYDGEWREGLQSGRGKMRYASGSEYDGEWKAGVKCGYGTMRWKASSEQYEGQWLDGQPHGLGVHTWVAAPVASSPRQLRCAPRWNRYEGAWRSGARDGVGTFYYADGSSYVGEWRGNRKHGSGAMTFKNGAVYRGEFFEDKMVDTDAAALALAQRHPSVHGCNNAYIRINVDDLFAREAASPPAAAGPALVLPAFGTALLGGGRAASPSGTPRTGAAPASRASSRPESSDCKSPSATSPLPGGSLLGSPRAAGGVVEETEDVDRLHRVLFRWNSELRQVYDRYAALPLLLGERSAHSAGCLSTGQWWCLMRDAGFSSARFTVATSDGVLQRIARNAARLDASWRAACGLPALATPARHDAPAFAAYGAHAPHRPLLYREFLEALVRVLVLRAEPSDTREVCVIVSEGIEKLVVFASADVATPTEDDAHLVMMAPTASYRVASRQLAPLFCACARRGADGGALRAQAWAKAVAAMTPGARRAAHAAVLATTPADESPSMLECSTVRVRDYARLVVDATSAAPLAVVLAAVSACFGPAAASSIDSLGDYLDVEMVFPEFIEAVGRVAHAVATSTRDDGGLNAAEWARELEATSRRLLGEVERAAVPAPSADGENDAAAATADAAAATAAAEPGDAAMEV